MCFSVISWQTTFESIIQKNSFVDKTSIIRDILDVLKLLTLSIDLSKQPKLPECEVLLMTAPRRFGKTTIIDMLRCFFGGYIPKENFMLLKVGQDEEIMRWWGTFNVVFVTFGHFGGQIRSEKDAQDACAAIIHATFIEYKYIASNIPKEHTESFTNWIDGEKYLKKTKNQISNGLRFLIQCVNYYTGYENPCLLVVDEFDRLCSRAMFNVNAHTLDNIICYYCDLVGDCVKYDPQCIAIVTGVMATICKGLSSLNNICYRRFLEDEKFCQYFGITKDEFDVVMGSSTIPVETQNLKEQALAWYNGYVAYNFQLLNTFSFKNFIAEGKTIPFWKESGKIFGVDKRTVRNDIIRNAFMKLLNNYQEEEEFVITLHHTLKPTDFTLIQNEKHQLIDHNLVMNFLLQQGYLCVTRKVSDSEVAIKIPNKEIRLEFLELMNEYFIEICKFNPEKINKCRLCFMNMDMKSVESCQKYLEVLKETLIELLYENTQSESFNEAWMESFLFSIFLDSFVIHVQKKVLETAKNKGKKKDLRTAKVLDMFIKGNDRCFIFEETVGDCTSAKDSLAKLVKKQYYLEAVKTSLPYLLIGIHVKKVEDFDVSKCIICITHIVEKVKRCKFPVLSQSCNYNDSV